MNTDAPPIYAVVDRRSDGRLRIVGEFVDPDAAAFAADLLRGAGADVAVELVTAVRDVEGAG